MTNEELLAIYMNPDDYQENFVKAVSEELARRNVSIENFRLEKENRMEIRQKQFETGREGNEVYIVLCFISALLGGFIGIIGGYVYSQSRHGDHSGTKYYVYNKRTRDKGMAMMILGIFVLVGALAWKFS